MAKELFRIEKRAQEPLEELASFSKKVAEEGIVLLKNEDHILPLISKKVALFGRIQFNYYKSGTGSGGLVNVEHVDSILEALLKNPRITLDQELISHYQAWVEEHPFDEGSGQWASEPWAQLEKEMDDSFVEYISKHNDVAVVVFGRTAGEDRDNSVAPGSYLLSLEEEKLLSVVTKYFKQTIVILNVGNIIDLSFLDRYRIKGLMLAWHGGMYGADALADVLTGYVSPSGKLPMTIANSITDYPSHHQFGLKGKVIYEEDIYVGYRYFETFCKDKVAFPFGFGLTYSKFSIKPVSFDMLKEDIIFKIQVKNIGNTSAKEVAQIYVEAPLGLLGKPKRVLVGFQKTKLLKPNEEELITLSIPLKNLASYDDKGLIFKSSYVIEKGSYHFHIGNSVRDTKKAFSILVEDDLIMEKLHEASAPNEPFKRIKPTSNYEVSFEDVPLRSVDYVKRIEREKPKEITPNHQSYSFLDVYQEKITLDEFVASLTPVEMIEMTRGEGMSSPKVTPGTAAAYGGVTESLKAKGIPVACASDGPSGIRMDSGAYASSLPIGTLQASTFNPEIVKHLYYLEGLEMNSYQIDMLLGPGMNIQRHPLNGRNFEYFSEDPLLTGKMGAATIEGLHEAGVTGTLKHVAANNQETDRFNVNSVVSERALREIYLKGFEIAVKEAKADAIMTSYNPINGLWTASNYDINKIIIRDEWGFDGIIVTDWWAKMNEFGEKEGSKSNTKAMIKSTNNIYMVIGDSHANSGNDNSLVSFKEGLLSLGELQRVAKHILKHLLKTHAFSRMHQINFKKSNYKIRPWFKQSAKKWYYSDIKPITINHKTFALSPYIYRHHLRELNELISISSVNSYEITTDKKHLRLIHPHPLGDMIYHISVGDDKHSNQRKITDGLVFKPLQALKTDIWDPYLLDINQYVTKNDGIEIIDGVMVATQKDGLVTYAIDVKTYGKYILALQVSCSASHIAQIPCSIYVGNDVKSTLTFHGTDDKIINSNAYIRLDVGKHFISFNFKKSGLKIHEVKCMRHG